MNPMKELKSEFDNLKLLLGNDFQEINLNKAKPKTVGIQNYPDYAMQGLDSDYTFYEKKGVKSDFIKIFKVKLNKKNHYSIGFSFNYLDKEIPSMHYSIKVNDALKTELFVVSNEMNLKEMKNKVKTTNKSLVKAENKTNENILNIINQEFINKNINELFEQKTNKIKP